MLDTTSLFTVGGVFAVMVASPGPATLAVATHSMSHGRHAGLHFGIGLSVGHILWGCVAATGVGAILQAASNALFILKLFGGLYLLWLAYTEAQAAARKEVNFMTSNSFGRWFSRGLLLNLTNPKVVLTWTATLSLATQQDESRMQVVAATMLCVALAFGTNLLYALVFSTRGAMTVYKHVRRWVQGAAAVLFTVFGFGLIRSAFERSV